MRTREVDEEEHVLAAKDVDPVLDARQVAEMLKELKQRT